MNVKIVNNSGFENPGYATAESAGIDLKAVLAVVGEQMSLVIAPGQREIISTEIYLELPSGLEAQVRPRSGLAAKHGLTVLNSPGTIDSDYRGEVKVIVINHGAEAVTINHGDRICQLVFTRFEHVRFDNVDVLGETDRGKSGLGSTGVL